MKLITALLLAIALPAHARPLAEQVNAMLPGTWGRITAENTAYDVDPAKNPALNPRAPLSASWDGALGYRGMFEAWSGGVWAESIGACGSIVHYGGGHKDHWGSQIVALDICGDNGTPKWRRLSDPYTGPILPFGQSLPGGTFPDGSPQPSHTMGTLAWDSDRKELIVPISQIENGLAVYSKNAYAWSYATKAWRGPFAYSGGQSGTAAYDPKRKVVWIQPFNGAQTSGQFAAFNPSTNTIQSFNKWTFPDAAYIYGMSGYDPDVDRLVQLNMPTYPGNLATIAEHNLDAPASPWVRAIQIGRPAAVKSEHSMSWSKERHAWIVWMDKLQTAEVWEVKRTGVDSVSSQPIYTWTLLTSAANSLNPAAALHSGGAFGKFQVVRIGCSEYLIGQLRLADGIVAFRLPGCYAAPPPPVEPPTQCASVAVVCEDFDGPLVGKVVKGFSMPRVENGEIILSIPSQSPADAGGNYRVGFPRAAEGDTLAYSYEILADQTAFDATPKGRKQETVWGGSAPCTGLEVTQTHRPGAPTVIWPYTQCGNKNFAVTLSNPTQYIYHQGDFDCRLTDLYKNDLSKCAVSVPFVWQTHYVEVHIGTYGQPNTTVEMWLKTGAGLWKQYVKRSDYTLVAGVGLDQIMLTVYTTGKDATAVHAPGKVRFRKLQVAREPFLAELRS